MTDASVWKDGMRVLVTGSSGYIGIVAAPMLAADGFDVVGLDTQLSYIHAWGGTFIVAIPRPQVIA